MLLGQPLGGEQQPDIIQIDRQGHIQLFEKFLPRLLAVFVAVRVPHKAYQAAVRVFKCLVGSRQGRAGVWPKNALVLYNADGCSGDEVRALAQAIQQDVKQKFGVTLDPEAIIV